MVFTPPLSGLSIALIVSAVLLLAVAAFTRQRGADTRVTDWFFVLLVADAAWALTSIVPLEAGTPAVAFAGEVSRTAAGSVAALSWFVFALVYTGRAAVLTRRRLAALALPLAVHVAAFATAPFHGASVSGLAVTVRPIATLVSYEFGPVYALATGYSLLLVLAGTGLVMWTALTDPDLYADQSIGLFVGAMMPIAGVALTVSGVFDVGNTNLTPATLGITAVGYGYALFRADLLETGPAVAARGERIAIERLSEGFLVVDGRGTVVEANSAARELLDEPALTGRRVTELLGTERPLASGQHVLRMDDGTVLESRITPLDDGDREGKGIGRVVTLRDVTARRRRQERLEVLNRVLRHNVRNDLTVVRGYARRIADGGAGDVDVPAAARRIARSADDLLGMAEKARTVEEALGTERGPRREPVALGSLLAECADATRADAPEAVDIRTDLEECEIRSDRDVLRIVIGELLDNAVRHNDRADPTVWVRLSVADDVRFRIADDGPGIPEQDRRAVLRGTETALDHASHFGLWMVRWGVLHLDGDLSISDRSPTGTVVEVTLPR